LVLGPVSFSHGRALAFADPRRYGRKGEYKVPPTIAAGKSVEIAIAPSARSVATFRLPGPPPQDSSAVAYSSCASGSGFFPQSFLLLGGRNRACVPMNVYVDGHQLGKLTISLFAGQCS
jgi:hypothetical protein